MANPHRGEVDLQVGEKSYKLRFTTNSICELEDYFGKGIAEVISEMEGKASMKMVRAMTWGALLDKNPITINDAGAILDEVGVNAIVEKLGAALKLYFPDAKEGEQNPPKAAAAE